MIKKKSYQAGFFAGQNNIGNIVIFGLAITSSAQKNDYNVLINSFVELMDGVPPETLVSDQDVGLISCLEDINSSDGYKINHLFDSWHYLKNIKLKIQ